MIKIVYSPQYEVDIGAHVFPTLKYRFVRDALQADCHVGARVVFASPSLSCDDDILLAHTGAYFEKLKAGTLSEQEILALELPYSRELVHWAILGCGGTTDACRRALGQHIGIHIGGGFHHAFADHGEGFCVLNDIAVALLTLRKEKTIRKAVVIDCDLHQGNGTAHIFRRIKDVFTFSIHQENNYPFYKPASDMDVGLPDRTGDKEYLAQLEEYIPKIIRDHTPDLMLYVAGADPYEHDQIGNLGLTMNGLKARDTYVFQQALDYHVPVAVVLAGGYARRQEDTVKIHVNTITTAIEMLAEG